VWNQTFPQPVKSCHPRTSYHYEQGILLFRTRRRPTHCTILRLVRITCHLAIAFSQLSLPILERHGGDVRCRPRGNSSSNLYLRFAASSVIFHFCHPEEAKSLACERLPTKDLCICSENGPPKCRPIALTERLFRILPQQRRAKVPAWMQQAWPNPNQILLERKGIENLSYIRPSKNLRHPERFPIRAGAARASRGSCCGLRIEGRFE